MLLRKASMWASLRPVFAPNNVVAVVVKIASLILLDLPSHCSATLCDLPRGRHADFGQSLASLGWLAYRFGSKTTVVERAVRQQLLFLKRQVVPKPFESGRDKA